MKSTSPIGAVSSYVALKSAISAGRCDDEARSRSRAAVTRAICWAQRESGDESATRLDVSYSVKPTIAVTGGLCAIAAAKTSGYMWRTHADEAPAYEPPTATVCLAPYSLIR